MILAEDMRHKILINKCISEIDEQIGRQSVFGATSAKIELDHCEYCDMINIVIGNYKAAGYKVTFPKTEVKMDSSGERFYVDWFVISWSE